jgi:pilus assembly protein CpaB
MNSKSLMMLGLAIVFGLGAMMLSSQLLSQGSGKPEETQDVLVATRDIKEEELLKPDMVKVTRIAKSSVPPGSFSSPKDVEERWVKTTLLEGDIVIEKKLGPKGMPPGLVANIPKGMRAYAMEVTEQSGVSGFVLPGHRVDVVRYESAEGVQHAETVLQDILVLAAGQVFTRAEERSLTTRTVTLAVTPDQVNTLVGARSKGQLSLSLRGVNDHDVVEVRRKDAEKEALEKRWKLEEDRRKQLEQRLAEMKTALAKLSTQPPPRPMPATPRFTTVYRGGISTPKHIERIRIDAESESEIASRLEPAAIPGIAGRQPPFGSALVAENLADEGDQP